MGRRKRWKPPEKQKDDTGRKRLVLVFGVFMIFLMVFSVASVINQGPDSENRMRYGDVEFVLEERASEGLVLVADLNGERVEFQNLPVQVQYLDVDPAAITILKEAEQVVLTTDPGLDNQQGALVDYSRLQLWLATGKTANAITREDPAFSLPVINCSHASRQMPVVVFTLSNDTGVRSEGYCIFLEGQQQEVTRAKDRIIFEYHGILQNGVVVE